MQEGKDVERVTLGEINKEQYILKNKEKTNTLAEANMDLNEAEKVMYVLNRNPDDNLEDIIEEKAKEQINFHQEIREVIQCQPSNQTEFAQKLEDTLNEELNEDYSASFYTAVNSFVDRKFGVDAFIIFKEGKDKIVYTLDVTINSSKDVYKADKIIQANGVDLENDTEVTNLINEEVENILTDFEKGGGTKMERKKRKRTKKKVN